MLNHVIDMPDNLKQKIEFCYGGWGGQVTRPCAPTLFSPVRMLLVHLVSINVFYSM